MMSLVSSEEQKQKDMFINGKILTLLSYRQIDQTKICSMYRKKKSPAQPATAHNKHHQPSSPAICRLSKPHSVHNLGRKRYLRAADSDLGVTSGEVTLSGNDLVVVLAEVHALAGPGIEVSLHVNRAGRALVLTNRPILLKGPGAINGWLVGAGRLSDLVGRAIGGNGTLVLGLRRRVVGAEVLNDVVLDEGVASPAVDGKVGVAVVVVGTGVGDGTMSRLVSLLRQMCLSKMVHIPGRSGVPSLSTDKVTAGSPAHAVLASGSVGVGSPGTAIRPPRVDWE
jgi:hypothetical protein